MSRTIELTATGEAGERFMGTLVCGRETGLTIGRDKGCDWVLTSREIVPQHLEIVSLDDDVWLCAAAPVQLEGRVIHGWARLYTSAALKFGSYELKLELSRRALGRVRRDEPFAPEAPTRVMAAVPQETSSGQARASETPLRSPIVAAAVPDEQPAPDLNELSKHFALPPQAKTQDRVQVSADEGLLTKRWAHVQGRWWVTIVASAVGLLVGLTKPTVMSAHAERADSGAVAPAASRPKPKTEVPTNVAPPLDAQAAAAALMRNDDVVAWRAYRALAANNAEYVPFVNLLTKRVQRLCEAGRATPEDCKDLL